MSAFALRLVAWLVALCLPLQGFAVAVERVSGPAHIHVAAAMPSALSAAQAELARGLHALGARASRLLGPLLPPERPMLVHASAHAHEHEHDHANGIGHHHHDAGEDGVVYVADSPTPATSAPGNTPKRVLADIETLAASLPVLAVMRVSATLQPPEALRFESHGSEPLERPPR